MNATNPEPRAQTQAPVQLQEATAPHDIRVDVDFTMSSREFAPLALQYLSGALAPGDPRHAFLADLQEAEIGMRGFRKMPTEPAYQSKIALQLPPFKVTFESPKDEIPPFVIGTHRLTALKFCQLTKLLLEQGPLAENDWRLEFVHRLNPKFPLVPAMPVFYPPVVGQTLSFGLMVSGLLMIGATAAALLAALFISLPLQPGPVARSDIMIAVAAGLLALFGHITYWRLLRRRSHIGARTIDPTMVEAFFASYQRQQETYHPVMHDREVDSAIGLALMLLPMHMVTAAICFYAASVTYLHHQMAPDLINSKKIEVILLRRLLEFWQPTPTQLLTQSAIYIVPLFLIGIFFLARLFQPLQIFK